MADTKISALTSLTVPAVEDLLAIVDDPSGTPITKKATLSAVFAAVVRSCNGRLTLATGTPVTTTDQSAKTTLYFTPFRGNTVALYNGSTGWVLHTLTELSITMVGLTASKPYDVFLDYNDGTPLLAVTVWTNDTTRATALTTQNGVYVKTGDTQQRYLGTIYIDSGGGAVSDTEAARHVWNYYHRALRPMRVVDATDSWTYSTNAWRAANGSTANRLSMVVGVVEDAVEASCHAMGTGANTSDYLWTAVGVDSTTVASGLFGTQEAHASNHYVASQAMYRGLFSAAGKHYLAWLERANVTTTGTFYGDAGAATSYQNGITGQVWA